MLHTPSGACHTRRRRISRRALEIALDRLHGLWTLSCFLKAPASYCVKIPRSIYRLMSPVHLRKLKGCGHRCFNHKFSIIIWDIRHTPSCVLWSVVHPSDVLLLWHCTVKTSVDCYLVERDPSKRRVKPVEPHLLQLDFAGVGSSSDDSDFKAMTDEDSGLCDCLCDALYLKQIS